MLHSFSELLKKLLMQGANFWNLREYIPDKARFHQCCCLGARVLEGLIVHLGKLKRLKPYSQEDRNIQVIIKTGACPNCEGTHMR